MTLVERLPITLSGRADRVLCRMFIPGEEDLIQGTSRIPEVVSRCLDLHESRVIAALEAVERDFVGRHRDLFGQFEEHYRAVANRVPNTISRKRQLLIGAY